MPNATARSRCQTSADSHQLSLVLIYKYIYDFSDTKLSAGARAIRRHSAVRQIVLALVLDVGENYT